MQICILNKTQSKSYEYISLSESSSSLQNSLVDLVSILIVFPYILPRRKTKGLLNSRDKFSRKEKMD